MTKNELKHLEQLLDKKLSNFPTKKDLQTEINGVKSDLQTEIASVKSDLQTEINGVKSDLQTEIASVKSDLQTEIKSVKTDLQAEIQTVKEGLEQTVRLTNSKLREDFKFALDESFRKYMDKILRGQDKVMGELEKQRQERAARQAHDDRVNERLERLEEHTNLPSFA